MSDNHDLLNDNDMCSFSGHEAEDMCFNCGDHTCGDSSFIKAYLNIRIIFPQKKERSMSDSFPLT